MSPMKPSLPLRNRFAAFASNQGGSISVISAITLVPLLIAAGSAVDMGLANRTLGQMQKAVDSAALAGAATYNMVNVAEDPHAGDAARIAAANMMVEANLPEQIATIADTPQVAIDGTEITVGLSAEMPTTFMKLVGIGTMSLNVTATADFSQTGHGCIVALGRNGNGIEVGGTVNLTVDDCWLYSNKSANKSIDIIGKATIHAGGSCSVGSTSVSNNATVYKNRTTGCGTMPDPMAAWTPPTPTGSCTYNNFSGGGGSSITLLPGTYCGGLQLSGYDAVHFDEGIYHITGGALTINSKGAVTGTKVGFFIGEDVASVTINGATNVTLTPPESGAMKDMLIAMEPVENATELTKNDLISAKINGGSLLDLTGTIYLPSASLDISGNSTSDSMGSQIIANSVKLTGTSNLKFKEQLDEFGNPIGPKFVTIVKLIK
jgi:Flp pilus assembly protein TadG